MRLPILMVSALLAPFLAAPLAQAQSMSVNKGQWSLSQDLYYEATADGEALDLPPEFNTLEECWSLDEEVLIDESMVEMFEGCVSRGVSSLPYGLEIKVSCNFDGLPVNGALTFSVSHDKDSFAAHMDLASPPGNPVDFKSQILMLGHRTGTCQAPG